MMIALFHEGEGVPAAASPATGLCHGTVCERCAQVYLTWPQWGHALICLHTHTIRGALRVRGVARLPIELDARTGEVLNIVRLNTPARRRALEVFKTLALAKYRQLLEAAA